MTIEIFIFFATILVAPFTFFIWSHLFTKNKKLKKYPTQINDLWGDLIFLPLFNAMLVNSIMKLITKDNPLNPISINQFNYNSILLYGSIIISIILTIIYLQYQRKTPKYTDWSKPKIGKLNAGGYYHGLYMFIQMTIVFYGIIEFHNNIWLWISLGGYLITAISQIIKDGYI